MYIFTVLLLFQKFWRIWRWIEKWSSRISGKIGYFQWGRKREEVSSSSKDAGLEETEGIGRQKYSELNEGLESIFIPSDDKICIGDKDQGISTNSQNIQLWLLTFFLNDVCMC